MKFRAVSQAFHDVLPGGIDHASLRIVDEQTRVLSVRRDVAQPPSQARDRGGMVTVHVDGGVGYAATSDLSRSGLRDAVDRARTWAERVASQMIYDPRDVPPTVPKGEYQTPVAESWNDLPLNERL